MRNPLRIRGELGELHVELRGPRAEADILLQPSQPTAISNIRLGAEQKFARVGSAAEALAQTLSDPVVRSIDLIGEAARVEFLGGHFKSSSESPSGPNPGLLCLR